MRYLPFALLILLACGGENTPPRVDVPGTEKDAKTKTLEAGAALLQDKSPISTINIYLDGFHFYSGNLQGQMEAHHYCTKVNEDLTQCVIYDGNGADARLMGVEYVVSARLFAGLPADEKALWHSHKYEVKSGTLVAPGIPDVAEHELMEKLVSTYGKTWHTWHTDNAAPRCPAAHGRLHRRRPAPPRTAGVARRPIRDLHRDQTPATCRHPGNTRRSDGRQRPRAERAAVAVSGRRRRALTLTPATARRSGPAFS